MSNNVKHGSRLKVVFEDVAIGTLTNITWNEDHGMQGVYGIGQFTPVELVNLRFTGSFNFSMLVLGVDKIKDLQYAERKNKSVGDIARAILTKEGFTIVIEDKYTGDLITSIAGVKLGNLGFTAGEGVLMQKSGSGMFKDPINAN